SLSRPSPSANLVGIWKGDPLRPARAGHHVHPVKNRVARGTAKSRRGVQPHSEIGMNSLSILGAITPVQLGLIALVVLFPLVFGPLVLGAVFIRERQVGVVVKKFGSRSLPPGQLIALGGESGYQADTLPPGLHFGYWRWQYRIIKMPVTVVSQGEIALVIAADGQAIPPERILGRVVDCDNF